MKSSLLSIQCGSCYKELLLYIKDGDWQLKRCYFDKICAPNELRMILMNPKSLDPDSIPNLTCKKCGITIGFPILYADNRLAFRLKRGFFVKSEVNKKPT
jgi:hypothetical protein